MRSRYRSMNRQLKKYLQDIIDSINAIDTYLQGKRDYFFYLQNKMIRRSVERELIDNWRGDEQAIKDIP